MHCLCDATTFENFTAHSPSPTLIPLLQARLDELMPESEDPFQELVHFYVLAPGDNASALKEAPGIDLLTAPIELASAHVDWFELTVILSDDGFGLVIYVPTSTQDAALKHRCIALSRPSVEADR